MPTRARRKFLASAGLAALSGLLMNCGVNSDATTGVGTPQVLPTEDPFNAVPAARSDKPRENAPQVTPADVQAFAAGHNTFGLDLYGRLRTGAGNLFFSPYSIAQVLTMTSAGARGQTAQQMATTLHSAFPQAQLHLAANALDQALMSRGATQGGFKLEIANSIWGQSGRTFLPEFLDVLAANYGAGLRLLDFKGASEAARTTINDTIARQTHDKIKDVLPPGSIDSFTQLVLANAIYFNAKWAQPFFQPDTRDGTFTPDQGSPVTVPMMKREILIPYVASQGYQAITLAYQGGVSMLLVLPDAGQLAAFEAGLDIAKLQSILDGMSQHDVVLAMPKFEYRSDSISLRDQLSALGMADVFASPDLSGIDGTRGLYISDVVHKAMVRLDEEGTEAAAASVALAATAMPPPPKQVILTIDRPFVFMIRDDTTGALLFLGRIANPKTA
jgi:serpin B